MFGAARYSIVDPCRDVAGRGQAYFELRRPLKRREKNLGTRQDECTAPDPLRNPDEGPSRSEVSVGRALKHSAHRKASVLQRIAP